MSYTNIGDIRLFYVSFYRNEKIEHIDPKLPVMIVLHGGPGIVDHQIEVDAWKIFSSQVQVIFLDQRGNGLSEDGDKTRWNLEQCGKDIYLFSKALGIENPIVAGVSWGGYVAMSYAIQYPGHPKALVFCNTEAKVSIEERKNAFAKYGNQEASEAVYAYDLNPESPENLNRFLEKCLPFFSKKSFTLIEPARTNLEMRAKFIKEENAIFDYRSKLNNIKCPTLLLAGERDPVHPSRCAEYTSLAIPEKYRHLYVIPDAGAPVYQDQPKIFEKHVQDFLTLILY